MSSLASGQLHGAGYSFRHTHPIGLVIEDRPTELSCTYVAVYFVIQFVQSCCLRIMGANFVIYLICNIEEMLNVMMYNACHIIVYLLLIYTVTTLALVIDLFEV